MSIYPSILFLVDLVMAFVSGYVMLSIAMGIGFVFGIIFINQTITNEGMWITFCRNMVLGFG
jgi:hypothetical protein